MVLAVGAYFIFGENRVSGGTISAKSDGDVIQVSAWQLFAEYEANEIRADNTFDKRTVVVSGVIEGIGKDILGQPYLVLSTGQLLGKVQCVLTSVAATEALAR